MNLRNVALFDSDEQEAKEYMLGLQEGSNEKWALEVSRANWGGRSRIKNALRYFKYFSVPFRVFINRKKYRTIIGWQAFYGINYSFFCRLFHVKKRNNLVIQHLVYKKKSGVIGKIYDKYIHYAVNSKYVDLIITDSKSYVEDLKKDFNIENVEFAPFGVNDFSSWVKNNDLRDNHFVLSIGRSNRDWDFLINGLGNQNCNVIICCDTLHRDDVPQNITIKNDVYGIESLKYIQNCACVIIPIEDGRLSSGETVLLQGMSFGKPIIVTRPSSLANDYIENDKNGITIDKDEETLRQAVEKVLQNQEFAKSIGEQARKDFLEKYSLKTHGRTVGEIVSAYKLV